MLKMLFKNKLSKFRFNKTKKISLIFHCSNVECIVLNAHCVKREEDKSVNRKEDKNRYISILGTVQFLPNKIYGCMNFSRVTAFNTFNNAPMKNYTYFVSFTNTKF